MDDGIVWDRVWSCVVVACTAARQRANEVEEVDLAHHHEMAQLFGAGVAAAAAAASEDSLV